MIKIKNLLRNILICTTLVFVATPTATMAIGMPTISEVGEWNTEDNRKVLISDTVADLDKFGPKTDGMSPGFVPIEAKIGLAFMDGFSYIADILDQSLVRFAIAFIIIMYILWMMLEAYNLIIAKATLQDTIKSMAKKGFITVVWIAILRIGPRDVFLGVMTPIMNIASMMTDGILNSVSSLLGTPLPDTCAAIKEYAKANIAASNILEPEAAASIMCLPTRLSAFCYYGINIGWKWVVGSIGASGFAFLCGIGMMAGFVYLTWKFAFIAFGVIADLFLGIVMLPLTAIAECVGKTSYKGIVGDIYNGFTKLFTTESLESQMKRILNAALHFVVLAVVIAVCAALISDRINISGNLPTLDDADVWTSLFVVAMAGYLAYNASEIATNIGGAIDSSMGETVKNDVKGLYKSTKSKTKEWYGIIKEARKSKKNP